MSLATALPLVLTLAAALFFYAGFVIARGSILVAARRLAVGLGLTPIVELPTWTRPVGVIAGVALTWAVFGPFLLLA